MYHALPRTPAKRQHEFRLLHPADVHLAGSRRAVVPEYFYRPNINIKINLANYYTFTKLNLTQKYYFEGAVTNFLLRPSRKVSGTQTLDDRGPLSRNRGLFPLTKGFH